MSVTTTLAMGEAAGGIADTNSASTVTHDYPLLAYNLLTATAASGGMGGGQLYILKHTTTV